MRAKILLKNSFDITGYSPRLQVILSAMKKYGLILADIGSNIYISEAPNERWDNDELHQLGNIKASSFEVVKFNWLNFYDDKVLWFFTRSIRLCYLNFGHFMPQIELQTIINSKIEICFDLSRSIDLYKIWTAATKEKAFNNLCCASATFVDCRAFYLSSIIFLKFAGVKIVAVLNGLCFNKSLSPVTK